MFMEVRGFILILLVSWLGHAEPQYYGTRVSSIALSGADSQSDLQLIPLHKGDTLTRENIRASIEALYNTKKYSSVEVDASVARDGGTDLIFRVRLYSFFGSVRLEPSNLLDRSVSAYVRIPLGEPFTTSAVDRIVSDITNLLKSEGYFEATVTPEYQTDEKNHLVRVILHAEPGLKPTIGAIQIHGGEQTFREKELRDTLGLSPGQEFSSSRLDNGTAKLRSKFTELGFLNTRVTVNRTYKPAMRLVDLDVTIQPGQFTLVETRGFEISRKKLRELIPVFEEGAVDQDLVEEGRVNVQRYMEQEGYFEASVMADTIEAPLDNAIQINYIITPGARHIIESVSIQGNTYFTTNTIRSRIKVRSAALLNRGVFSPTLLENDERTIEAMYRNAGFENVVVRGSYEERQHIMDVTIRIQEGVQSVVGAISFENNHAVSDQDLENAVALKEGDTYAPVAVDEARAAITQLYYSRGYPDVRVETDTQSLETDQMRVTFRISEGSPYRIGNILVSGNTLTKDKIVHRDSQLYPNTPYDPEEILESQRRLYATGLFDRVDIVTLQQNLPGIRNVLIHVEDSKPILVTYGIGYQEFERARGTIEISHNDLFGLDRSISLRLRGSQRERLAQATYHEPWLFNHPLDGFASILLEHTERPSFVANRIDFSIQTLKRFAAQRNFLLTASYQTVNLQDILVNPLADRFPDERGIIQIARIGSSFIQDRRNDPINPSSGSISTTTFQVASRLFGSEVNFTSLFNQSSFYRSAPLGGVLASSVRLGWNHPFGETHQLPITERYFAGGSTTLRGFSFDEAQPSGGNLLAIGNLEYRAPLSIFPISNVGGALFFDTGNAFPAFSDIRLSDVTYTAGFGLRYQTPVGPVRLDFGFNLHPRTNIDGTREARMKVFFTLGNAF